ncbi:low molecular weight protein-tyrosine-phosphatase [Streptomyces sp. NPDC007905]|uniref:low molecular weight protein-tyrosine-phosphatase n=1 Tax=Streptomyces sp. NPDC007905 TaxID=3364788 RepID=UPI0036E3FC91
MGAVYRVCFVCTGNICRSPMAALVFGALVERAGLADRVAVDSGGTRDMFAGCTADVRAIAVLEAAGYPSDHTARQLRPRWLRTRDLLVALDVGHERALRRMVAEYGGGEVALLRSFDSGLPEGASLGVPDPYSRGQAAFAECLAMVEPACTGLLETIRGRVAKG